MWPDVHNDLATKIRKQLTPQLRPKYVARLNSYTVKDNNPISEYGVMYPDIEVVFQRRIDIAMESMVAHVGYETIEGAEPPSLSIPYFPNFVVKIPFIEIRDTDQNRLVSCIEILSPVNKRKPGLKAYLKKRYKMHKAGVHFLEIDLLRRGTRTVQHSTLPPTDYLVALTRAKKSSTEIWPIQLRSKLPVVPVPLSEPDEDVSLNLQKALNEVYEDAGYDVSIDYDKEPPPPKLSEEEMAWVKSLR